MTKIEIAEDIVHQICEPVHDIAPYGVKGFSIAEYGQKVRIGKMYKLNSTDPDHIGPSIVSEIMTMYMRSEEVPDMYVVKISAKNSTEKTIFVDPTGWIDLYLPETTSQRRA